MTSPFGYVTNEREIATEIWDLIREFYALYPQYSKLDLYIVGESYGEWNLAVAKLPLNREEYMADTV